MSERRTIREAKLPAPGNLRRSAPAVVAIYVVLLAMALGTASTAFPASTAPVATPLSTSIQTSAGTWATVPMGHLDQPLNTFWQLFYLPPDGSRWSNQAASLATATNGGIELSTPDGRSLLVGVRPSNLLHFSPLVGTSDGGRTWSSGTPLSSLGDHPSALAADEGGSEIALVSRDGNAAVVTTSRGSSTWRTLTTQSDLASSAAGQRCGLGSLTAVGYGLDADQLVASECDRPGVVGVFARVGATWHLVGPTLPTPLDRGSVEVLGLRQTGAGAAALLAISRVGATDFAVAFASSSGQWALSRSFALSAGEQVKSFGPAGGTGDFVLLEEASRAERLLVLSGPGASWQTLPEPPARTATIAFSPRGRVDALSVNDTVLTDWILAGSTHRWTKGQVLDVAIQFGSSG